VCASDTLALGASVVLGSSVPVVGYDDTPVASALGLSSVEQPLVEVAGAVLSLLLDDSEPRHRLLRPRTIWR
jgi:DNA-binding LacI/PurR family transcriptional regulator